MRSVEALKDIAPLAAKAAEVAAKLVKDEPVSSAQKIGGVPVIAAPVVLVTADNVRSSLIDTGFHTTDAVKSCR